jgi:hypothetical protein
MTTISLRRAASATALTLVLSGAGAAFAQSTAGTTDLKTTYVQRIDGARDGDDAGDRVDNAGDVNHDGRDDLIIGAYAADRGGRTDTGAAYLVQSSSARHVHLDAGGPNVVEIRGARKNDNIGNIVAGLGDVNGDGRPDQAVGSDDVADPRRLSVSPAWVILSTGGRHVINLRKPGKGIVRIDGSDPDAEIDSIAGAGDFNGDGIADIVVGESNADGDEDSAYIILGSRGFRHVNLGDYGDDEIPIYSGTQAGLGRSVAGVADVNGDGLADVLVGYDGGAVVVFGRKDTAKIEAQGTAFGGYDIGAATTDAPPSLGGAVSGIGDLNGDGLADLAISASTAPAKGRRHGGLVAVYYGKAGPEPQAYPPAPAEGLQIYGASKDDRAGYAIAGPGDVTGDGRPDIVVGAFLGGGMGRLDAGDTYLVSPPATGGDIDLSHLGPNVQRWVGSAAQEQSGFAVRGADTNGDGHPEVVIGAGFADHVHPNSGSVYIVRPR